MKLRAHHRRQRSALAGAYQGNRRSRLPALRIRTITGSSDRARVLRKSLSRKANERVPSLLERFVFGSPPVFFTRRVAGHIVPSGKVCRLFSVEDVPILVLEGDVRQQSFVIKLAL